MIAIRRVSARYRRMLRNLLLAAVAVCPITTAALAQGTQMKSPDDTKQVSIGGCLTARTKSGGYILSTVFSPPITVVGPNYLAAGMGHHVMLKGTWQSNGIAPEKNEALPKLFVATEVKVDSRQCASPPSSPENTATTPAKSSGGH